MQISDKEVKNILLNREALVSEIETLLEGIDDPQFEIDPQLVADLTQKVMAMPDRENRIAELKAEIEAGTYRPSAEQIVDAMVRRNIGNIRR